MARASKVLTFFTLATTGAAIISLDFSKAQVDSNDLGRADGLVYTWPDDGLTLSIKNKTEYIAGNESDNGLKGGYGTLNMRQGTCAVFVVRIENTLAREKEWTDQNSFYFSVLDIDGGPGDDNMESVRLNGFREYFTSGGDSNLIVRSLDDGSVVFKGTTIGVPRDAPTNTSELDDPQSNKAFTVLFADVAFFELQLCVGGDYNDGGRKFFFGGVSSLVDRYTGHCRTGEGTTAPQAALDFDLVDVSQNNLGGKGPVWISDEELRFTNIGSVGTRNADLVVKTDDEYLPDDNKFNGNAKEFGIISVKCDTKVSFEFSLVESETQRLLPPANWVIGFFDFDQGMNNNAREVLTLDGADDRYLERTTNVQVTENGTTVEFKSTVMGTGGDTPETSHFMNQLQKDKGVLLYFQNKSSFRVTLSVEGGPSDGGRNFMFVAYAPMEKTDPDMTPCADDRKGRPLLEDLPAARAKFLQRSAVRLTA